MNGPGADRTTAFEGAIVAGKYRIEHVLGRGGMGVVLAATHLHLGTRVALKFLNENIANDQKVVARFLREARSSAALKSEHICRVLDFGTEGSLPYIVMELLEGTDLARLVKLRPLDIPTAAEYVMQACMGLAEAHAAQIIHRDLKPGNLFLTQRPGGTPLVKVLDFGVAKAPEAQDFSLTQTQNVVGSPGFMSPEQLRSARNVDQRSDVWSLGVILYKVVSGRQPFKADALTDLAIAIAMDPVPPLVEAPPDFAAIVFKCLEKDPARRYQNVTELGTALSQFVNRGRPTTTFFAQDEHSSVQNQSNLLPHPPAPPLVMPGANDYSNNRLTLVPEQPTTLQGASSVHDSIAPAPKSRRGLVIGASAAIAIAIGIVVGVGMTNKSTTAASITSHPTAADPSTGAAGTNDSSDTKPAGAGAADTAANAATTNAATTDTKSGAANNGTANADTNAANAGATDATSGTSASGAASDAKSGTALRASTTGTTAATGATAGTTAATGTTATAGTTAATGTTATTTATTAGTATSSAAAKAAVKKSTPKTSTPKTETKVDPKSTKPKDFGESRI